MVRERGRTEAEFSGRVVGMGEVVRAGTRACCWKAPWVGCEVDVPFAWLRGEWC